jgi:hypothetical protein
MEPLLEELLLLRLKYIMDIELLKFLVCEVYAELLKRISLKILEPKDVEQPYGKFNSEDGLPCHHTYRLAYVMRLEVVLGDDREVESLHHPREEAVVEVGGERTFEDM